MPSMPEVAEVVEDTAPIEVVERTEVVEPTEAGNVTAVGDFIDGYRIIRTVSETPTSVIYKAEQNGTKRRVAIKVIFNRPGSMADSLKRPEEEVQRLKHLNHPGIVAFLDMGTTPEGHCYFANEFVRGVPLDEYVKIHKLSLQNRLTLFKKICDAVAYAHQQLLLHRDLRPSKIVIDGKCNPKIVGLGVAAVTNVDLKNTDASSDDPELRRFLAYKSPEQMTGRAVDIDVRSDLYALGVLLYELLTEQLPFGLGSCKADDIVKNICKNRPRIPASARRAMGDDLTAIVQKSLEKDPNARYKTVAALSQDLQNYFDQKPVQARPAGALYEFRKLMARHKSRTISVLLMTAAVIGFGAHVHLTTRQAGQQLIQQEHERSSAELTTLTVAKELAEQKLADAKKAFEARLAEYKDFDARVSHFESQLASAKKTNDSLRTEVAGAKLKAEASEEVSQFLMRLLQVPGDVKSNRGQTTVADMLDHGAGQVARQFGGRPIIQAALFDALGLAYQRLGFHGKAAGQIRAALDARRQALGETHEDTIDSMNNLATALFSEGNHEEAEPLCRQIVASTRHTFGDEDPKTLTAMNNLGMTLYSLGNLAEAERNLRQTLAGRRRVFGGDHRKTVTTAHNLGKVLFDQGKPEEAATLFRETLDVKRRELGDDHLDVTGVMLELAESLMAQGDSVGAHSLLQKCFDIRKKALPQRHWLMSYTKGAMGQCLAVQGRYELAEPLVLSSYSRIKTVRGNNDEFTQRSLRRVVDLYEAWGKPEKAAKYRAVLKPTTP